MTGKLSDLSISIRLLILGVVIFSVAYSATIGVLGQALWHEEAGGSLVESEGDVVGSELIGQEFDDPRYFHSRPSSIEYDARQSGSQNLGPTNPELSERVRNDLEEMNDTAYGDEVPSVLVTESGSALDPHITVRSAMYQIPRISNNTGISKQQLRSLLRDHTEEKLLGVYGMKKVNVLKLNIEIKSMIEK